MQFDITGLANLSLPTPDFGDPSDFATFTVAGNFFHLSPVTVADNFQILELWNTVGGGLTSFLWGAIRATQDVLLEFTVTTPERYAYVEVHSGPWSVFGGRVGAGEVGVTNTAFQAAGVAETAGTHFGNVTRLRAKRNVADGIGDAVVEMFLVL